MAAWPASGLWDTYLTIGADDITFNDTEFTDGLFNGDGKGSIVRGSHLVEPNGEGGWFDSNPETAETGDVLIAQLTYPESTIPRFSATARIQLAGGRTEDVHIGFGVAAGSCYEMLSFCDLNNDGHVNFSDLLQLLSAWGSCSDECCVEDIDLDGEVDFGDLLLLLSEWGTCPLIKS